MSRERERVTITCGCGWHINLEGFMAAFNAEKAYQNHRKFCPNTAGAGDPEPQP